MAKLKTFGGVIVFGIVTSSPQLLPQVDGVGLYCPVGCAGSRSSSDTPEERAVVGSGRYSDH